MCDWPRLPQRFDFSDALKYDSIKTINNLKNKNFKINILSGDRKATVMELAQKIGLQETDIKWGLLPEIRQIGL